MIKRPQVKLGPIDYLASLIAFALAGLFLRNWAGWPLWLSVLGGWGASVLAMTGTFIGIGAWENHKSKKLGQPWDKWPND